MAVIPVLGRYCFREEGDADIEGGVSVWKMTSIRSTAVV